MPARPLARLTALGALALSYFLSAKLGLALATINASASPIWPPTGLAIAAFLILGRSAWPGVFVGAFFANLTTAGNEWTSAGIALGNTLEASVGAALVSRFAGGVHAFDRIATVPRFFLLAGFVATLVSPTIGVLSLALGGYAPWSSFGPIWATWWLGDAGGALVVAPVLILWSTRFPPRLSARQWGEAAIVAGGSILAAFLVFGPQPLGQAHYPLSFLPVPAIAWAAFRLGTRAAALAVLAVASFATVGTLSGWGPFDLESQNDSLLIEQLYLVVLSGTALALGAVANERRRATLALEEGRDQLEQRVNLRTASLSDTVRALENEVSLRRQAQDRVVEQQRLLAQAEATAHLGSWEWDILANHVRGSEELFRVFGLRPYEFKADLAGFLERVHPDDRSLVEQTITASKENLRPFELNHRIVLPNGTVRWVHARASVMADAEGRATGMFGTAQDVTDRKTSEDKFRGLVEAAPDASVIVNEKGRIVLINGQTERLFGYRRAEVIGQSVEMLIPDRYRSSHASAREAYMASPRARPMGAGLELFGRRKDGSEFPVEISLSPLETEEGRLVSSTIRDISDRKRVEAERAEAQEKSRELEHLKRLDRFKTQFINTAAHELNTPLTPIKAQMHILSTDPRSTLSPEQRHSMEVLGRNVDRLGRLIDDLLQSARLQSDRLGINRRHTDLVRIVLEALESFRGSARQTGVELTSRLPDQLELEADDSRIGQVLYNLLNNALKFTPAGGRVHVEVWRDKDEALIAVHDTGIGVATEQVAKLFQPFMQVHDTTSIRARGTGLGLYISRGIVELHGGRIWCESAGPGKGSTFLVALPVAWRVPEPRPKAPDVESLSNVELRLRGAPSETTRPESTG